MKKEFKVGNKVWSKEYGYGVVLPRDEHSIKYPIRVSFNKDEMPENYTEEGRYLVGGDIELFHKRDVFPNLFQRIINKLKKKS